MHHAVLSNLAEQSISGSLVRSIITLIKCYSKRHGLLVIEIDPIRQYLLIANPNHTFKNSLRLLVTSDSEGLVSSEDDATPLKLYLQMTTVTF